MKMNKNNGKEIRFSGVLSDIAISMVSEFVDIMDNVVVDLEDIADDLENFVKYDRDLYADNNLGLYDKFEDVLADFKKVLCTYARISAYKVLLREEFTFDKAFIYMKDDRVLKKLDTVLLRMYEGSMLTFMPFLMEYILEAMAIYDISIKLDIKGDIVRGYTGENRIGSHETEFVIKRFYIC